MKTELNGCPATHRHSVHHLDASLDIREHVHGGEDSLALVLFIQLPVSPAIRGEGCGEDEPLWGVKL